MSSESDNVTIQETFHNAVFNFQEADRDRFWPGVSQDQTLYAQLVRQAAGNRARSRSRSPVPDTAAGPSAATLALAAAAAPAPVAAADLAAPDPPPDAPEAAEAPAAEAPAAAAADEAAEEPEEAAEEAEEAGAAEEVPAWRTLLPGLLSLVQDEADMQARHTLALGRLLGQIINELVHATDEEDLSRRLRGCRFC